MCECVHMWMFKGRKWKPCQKKKGAPCSTSPAPFSNTNLLGKKISAHFNEMLLLCGTGKLAWPIVAGTMPPFRGCPLCTDLCIVQSLLAPFATHTRPAGTEMAAQLTRFTIPPPVHTTIEGHGHRHLYGTQEAEEGILGPHRQVVLPTSP